MYQGETITTTVTGFPVPLTSAQNVHVIFRDRNGVCQWFVMPACDVYVAAD